MMRVFALFIFCISGCATAPVLSQNSARVAPDSAVQSCHFVKVVSCQRGQMMTSFQDNIDACTVDLRNRASEIGADTIVLQTSQVNPTGNVALGDDCTNCAAMTAVAYDCQSQHAKN